MVLLVGLVPFILAALKNQWDNDLLLVGSIWGCAAGILGMLFSPMFIWLASRHNMLGACFLGGPIAIVSVPASCIIAHVEDILWHGTRWLGIANMFNDMGLILGYEMIFLPIMFSVGILAGVTLLLI